MGSELSGIDEIVGTAVGNGVLDPAVVAEFKQYTIDAICHTFGVPRDMLPTSTGADKRAMRLAIFSSTLSIDPSTKVGAVIVNESGRVIGSGYNRVPAGVTTTDRAHRLACTIHAETNAILSTRSPNLHGATIYITHPPCCNCAALIANVGIKRVVHMAPSPEFAERWYESLGRAQALLAECGIAREQFDA